MRGICVLFVASISSNFQFTKLREISFFVLHHIQIKAKMFLSILFCEQVKQYRTSKTRTSHNTVRRSDNIKLVKFMWRTGEGIRTNFQNSCLAYHSRTTSPQATDHVNFSHSVRKFLPALSQVNNKTKANSQNFSAISQPNDIVGSNETT